MDGKRRVSLLLRIGDLVRCSLDTNGFLPPVAALLATELVDWCALDLVEDRDFVRAVTAHGDPVRHALARKLEGRWPADEGAPWGPLRVLRTQRYLYFPEIHDPMLLVPAADAERRGVVVALGLGAVVCQPMLSSGGVVGVLTGIRGKARPPFRPAELAVLRTVASRLAEGVAHSRLYRDLQAANRAKDEFMAMLGHELRTPIAAIRDAVSAMERIGDGGGRTAGLCQIIARQSQHLGRLVEDLLDVARLTTGKIALRLQPVDLAELAERCVAALREPGTRREHEVVVHARPVTVEADPTRLDQVLSNLLENAVKYTPPGGRIEIHVRREGGAAVLRVRDTGAGIPANLLPRIFDLFEQGQRTLAREGGGLGIGLTLVRRLVELHGGTVHVSSPGPGHGTTVEVRLPLGSDLAAGPEPPAAGTSAPVAPRRILLVEDNADAREALRTLLEADGHHVDVAENGRAGLERATDSAPDVALVDIGLPGMDGYALVRELRATPAGRSIYLVALTGYGQPEDRRRAIEAGFDAHLVKPVDPDRLTRILGGARVA